MKLFTAIWLATFVMWIIAKIIYKNARFVSAYDDMMLRRFTEKHVDKYTADQYPDPHN